MPNTLLELRVASDNEGPIVAEHLFAALHALSHPVSFEIATIKERIRFFVWTPKDSKAFIESQIYAQYPTAEISETEDYANITKRPPAVCGAYLTLQAPGIYPIKRYSQFEDKLQRFVVDPLSAITESLAKLSDPRDQFWLQIVIKPLPEKYRKIFRNCLKSLQKRTFLNINSLQNAYIRFYCTRKKFIRVLLFPVFFGFWLESLASRGQPLPSRSPSTQEEAYRSRDRETALEAATDKVLKLMFETTIRLVYLSHTTHSSQGKAKIREVAGAFKQFAIPYSNTFTLSSLTTLPSIVTHYQNRHISNSFVANTEEVASLYHLPSLNVVTPELDKILSRTLPPPLDLPTLKTPRKKN